MSLVVKLVNGTEKQVEVPDLTITVAQFKDVAAPAVGIPADEQRVVHKGKVLKDHDVLSAVGVEHGNAVHIVRSKKRDAPPAEVPTPATNSTSAPTPSVSASAPNAPVTTGSAAPNPYAALLGGSFGTPATAGAGVSPSAYAASPWGMPAGMPAGSPFGAGYSPEMMTQMMQNPMMMQMVQQAMQDPSFIDYMRQTNPMLANMPPEMIQQSMQMMMSNPQLMSQMMSMSAGASGQQPFGSTGAAPSAAPPTTGFNFNPAAFAPPVAQGNPREIYREQLQQLRDMGFPNEDANIAALQQSQGNLSFAIERLLGTLN